MASAEASGQGMDLAERDSLGLSDFDESEDFGGGHGP